MVVVVKRVKVHKEAAGTAVDEGTPPPSMILPGQLKVDDRHSDETGHDQQHGECKEKDAKERVNFVSPDARKYVVQFDIDGGEWQEACNDERNRAAHVPRGMRYLPRNFCGAAGGIKVTR